MLNPVLNAILIGLLIALGAGAATVGYYRYAPMQNVLANDPHVPGPFGPLSASDANRDG